MPGLLSPTLSEALEEAKGRLQDIYGECLRQLILYGSHARGEATEESDVDMLVVLRGPIENSYEEVKRMTDVQIALFERYGVHFSLQAYAEQEFEDRQGPFMHNVYEEGLEV